MIKEVIIIILKLNHEVDSGQDPSQRKNKNIYYHSLKTQFRG
jgi:hypothetical protein